MRLVGDLHTQEVEDGRCSRCELEARSHARFCAFCGKLLRQPPEDPGVVAANRFRGWFDQELHQFSDWDVLSGNGWNVAQLVAGGYVRMQNFDACLEEWDPPDFEDHLEEGRPWWDTLGFETGELTSDEGI